MNCTELLNETFDAENVDINDYHTKTDIPTNVWQLIDW